MYIHQYMYTCMSVCLCPSHLISVPTPCLECVHASVHDFMSTWLSMSAPPLWIVTWKPGFPCVAVCVCPSHPVSGHTPCLECVHASVHDFMSTWLSMSAPPLWIVRWKPGYPCVAVCVCVCPSHPASVPTPCLECVHASVHEFMSI